MRGATHKLDAELAFEQAHLTAQRRLGDMQPLSRAREVALACDRQEVAQPPEVDHPPIVIEGGNFGFA